MRRNVGAIERAVSIAVGTTILASRLRKPGQGAAVAAGTGLILRGAFGYCPVNAAVGRNTASDDTRIALGGPRGLHIRRGVTIRRRPEEIYRFWRDLSNLAKFMSHVLEVREIDDRRSHWVIRGPAGRRLEWDAELITDEPGSLISWRTLPGADVVSAGSVRFKPTLRGATEVLLHLQYDPPGGAAARWILTLLGQDPDSHVREDLRRLKELLEAGELPTTSGQPTGRRTALFTAGKTLVNW
jgi:uncharacterized membrane protein